MNILNLTEKMTVELLFDIIFQWEKDYEENFNDYFSSRVITVNKWVDFLKKKGIDISEIDIDDADDMLECMPYDDSYDIDLYKKNLQLVSEYFINNKKNLYWLLNELNSGEWAKWWNNEIEPKLRML